MKNQNGFVKFLFWFTYVVAAAAAWFHTFSVFEQSDPWFIAALAASAIDGALAFTIYLGGKVVGNQRHAALVGTFVFAAMSAMSQVIQRFYGLGIQEQMPNWLRIVSLALVPMATTGSVLILGLVKYFDKDNDGIPDIFQNRDRIVPARIQTRPAMSFPQEMPVLPTVTKPRTDGQGKYKREVIPPETEEDKTPVPLSRG